MDPIALDSQTLLRPLNPADSPVVHSLILKNRDHLDRWLRWSAPVQTIGDVDALIARFQTQEQEGNGFHLGI